MKKIVLFDMDGTLTEARQKMEIEMEQQLRILQEAGFEIGILTGSGMNYIKQQCPGLFNISLADTSKIHFLPCNGTKYILNKKTIYERNMRDYMGEKLWRRLMTIVSSLQHQLVLQNDFPLTGHFFDYRGSMLNWCPIGRNANLEDREEWNRINKNEKIRYDLLESLKNHIEKNINHLGDLSKPGVELDIKYGGDTSFDIFPLGWDKTYVLDKTDMFSEYDNVYFIGDRCEKDGNDYEIYSHKKVKGYKTLNPENTILIIKKIIKEEK